MKQHLLSMNEDHFNIYSKNINCNRFQASTSYSVNGLSTLISECEHTAIEKCILLKAENIKSNTKTKKQDSVFGIMPRNHCVC